MSGMTLNRKLWLALALVWLGVIGVGIFGAVEVPNTMLAERKAGIDNLVESAQGIVENYYALAQAGVAPGGRAYLPHITLARLPRKAGVETAIERFLADRAALSSDSFTPDALLLFESRLGHEGARYEAVARYPFA